MFKTDLVRNRIEQQKRNYPELNIGADPEWIATHENGCSISADRLLYGTIANHRSNLMKSPIGTDGNRFVGEFRPTPSYASGKQILSDSLSKLVNRLPKEYNNTKIYYFTGPIRYGEPLGGHFHLSGDINVHKRCYTHNSAYRCLVFTIDYFLAPFLEAIFPKGAIEGRLNSGYGGTKDWKHIKPRYVEYRSLPSWLSNPQLVIVLEALIRDTVGLWTAIPKFCYDSEGGVVHTRKKSGGIFIKRSQEIRHLLSDTKSWKEAAKIIALPTFMKNNMCRIDIKKWSAWL